MTAFTRRLLFSVFSLISFFVTQAQIGIGTNSPDSSAALHIEDTARGLLIPRMTSLQKNALRRPAEGLMIYQTDSLKGFWYFTNGQWRSMIPANNGGKQTVILSDNITNSEANAKIAAEVGPNTQIIRITGCTELTAVDLSSVTGVLEIYIYDNPLLQTVNLSRLETIDGSFFIDQCPSLTNLDISGLKRITQTSPDVFGFKITKTGLPLLACPSLEKVTGSFYIGSNDSMLSISVPQLVYQGTKTSITISGNNELTSVTCDLLDIIEYFVIQYNRKLTSISLPHLTKVSDLKIAGNFELTSISFPAIVNLKNSFIWIDLNDKLTHISFPAMTQMTNSRLSFSDLPLLTSLNIPALTEINGGYLAIGNAPTITAFTIPLLTACSGTIYGTYIQNATMSFPALTSLSGTISVYKILSLSAPALTSANYIHVEKSALTSLNLPLLNIVDSLILSDNTGISNLSFPALNNAQFCHLKGNSATTLSMPNLSAAGSIIFEMGKFPSLSLPSLHSGTLNVIDNNNLVSLTAPLYDSGAINFSNNLILNDISFPSLVSSSDINITNNAALQSVSFPVLANLTGTGSTTSNIQGNYLLTAINLNNLSAMNITTFDLSSNKFSSAVINYLLGKFVSINPPISGKTLNLKQLDPSESPMNPTSPSPPTGQGIIDKATLIARPNTVITD